jgi:two-component system CheB/CheR fusion protein
VGIGASAGGLDALEKFFAHVPLDTGLAFVVVQHTSAQYKTLLASLLQTVTRLPVQDAHNGLVLKPDTVHVMPTGGELTVERGCLHFQVAPKAQGLHWPIDDFLKSLALDQQDRAVGVILSGMGNDGVQGMQAIHAAGGLCLVQQPETAAFASMPQSAIDAGGIDAVASPEDLPLCLVQKAVPMATTSPPPAPSAASDTDTTKPRPVDGLRAIVDMLNQQLHHDFSQYKPSTLQRRVERRMHVHQLSRMADYVHHLQDNPQELKLLFSEMLIGVTSFFRDPPIWQDLASHVFPKWLDAAQQPSVRAWVLGCSTGEEAYSLAMALRESQDLASGPRRAVQIYATDLNPAAITLARKGWYSAAALASVSPERRERFFIPKDGGYTVHPDIRSMVMFAQHDVIVDPPFTQLDLLMCRNVLIYFSALLQRRLMPLFHFSLRSAGVLVLGSAETVGRSQHLFTSLIPGSRIYGRMAQSVPTDSQVFPVQRRLDARPTHKELTVFSAPATPPHNLQSLADHVLLQTFSPAAVLVNASGDILYISGRTGAYLEPAAGKANWNVHVMLRPAWRAQVAMALRQALQDQQTVVLNALPLQAVADRQLQVTVHPLQEPKGLEGTAMLVFQEMPRPAALALPDKATGDKDPVQQAELQMARDEMQTLRQEMSSSKDQMHALNESLKASNEELQSANEELTTAKEEGQSMNEELQTINSELQTRLDDLALAQSDMQNLLNSTDIATLFLDNGLNVRRYTEQAVPIFHLRESDVGRPLSDLANTLDYPSLLHDVQTTLQSLTAHTQAVSAADGRWFSVRIMPYKTLANTVNGAVLTFVDISTAKALEFRLREAN